MKQDKQHIEYELRKINAFRTFRTIGCQVLPLVFMILIILAIILPGLLNKKSSVWESRAKATLRGFGEVQLAYQRVNLDKYFGSWNALKRTGYIPEGCTEKNIMEYYFLYTGVNNPVIYSGDLAYERGVHYPSFTAIAFPRKTTPPGYLATFSIHEDQTLRVYRDTSPGAIAWGEDGDFGARTWEPIR